MKTESFSSILMVLLFLTSAPVSAAQVNISLYSETLYDARISGATNESRVRVLPSWDKKWLRPYLGVTFSKDLSHGKAPLLTENMIAPTLGLQIQPLSFLSFFSEARRLYRINNERRSDSENELRYGAYAYYFKEFGSYFFNESYGEIVVVDRVDKKPVTVLWNKIGWRSLPKPWLRPDLYAEGFVRLSPNPGYGPDEEEIRLGARVTFLRGFWALGLSVNYAPVSNVKKHGVDTLLVISREVF